jgi:outer membrane lipoprotein-sorting protein
MSLLPVCVAATLLGAISTARVVAATLPASGQFDATSTISAPHVTVKISQSITFKGDNFRIDSGRPIDLIPFSRIRNNGTVYSYLPNDQTAMREPSANKTESLQADLLAQKNQFVTGATKSGKDTVAGFPCDVYMEPAQENGNVTMKVWVSADPKFPFVMKTEEVHHKEGVTETLEISNVRLSSLISDTVFALPKDTKVVDAPTQSQSQGGQPPMGSAPGGQAPPPSGAATGAPGSGTAPAPN